MDARFSIGDAARVQWPSVNLLPEPDAMRDRQLLLGREVVVLSHRPGWLQVETSQDGYRGFVPEPSLTPVHVVTHVVSAAGTIGFSEPDFKSRETFPLSLGAQVQVEERVAQFGRTNLGYFPMCHLRAVDDLSDDPVTEAEKLLGSPYLWGGNTRGGIDCSGLVQVAAHLCGLPCPADSGPQSTGFGSLLPEDTPLRRGDTLYWKGHVAWVADSDTILHANAHHMAVVHEPMLGAMERIAAQGDGPVICARRPPERKA